MRFISWLLRLSFVAALVLALFALPASAAPGDATADRVFGQGGSFSANGPNNPAIGASSLFVPSGAAIDSAGRLYVADGGNHRVLEYDSPLTSQTATRVFGQGGSTTSNVANNGGVSADSLYAPAAVAVDGAGHLYVADTANHRVLEYDSPLTSQTANRVFGQGGSFTANVANNGGVSPDSLYYPQAVAVDLAGRLYIVDQGNNRVLEYDTPLTSQTANRVFGQGGSFTSNAANSGGLSADSLSSPFGAAVDASGRLYIGDAVNNRVLEFDSPLSSLTPTRVFGQGGSFTSGLANNGGISASTLYAPDSVVVDGSGRLYVADAGNNRVLAFTAPLVSQTANGVIGQGGSFTSDSPNNGGVSASSLYYPRHVTVNATGDVYVVDTANNRILEYDSPVFLSVGGIAEQPDVGALPPAATQRVGQATTYVLGGSIALTVLTMTGASAWYVRRKRSG